MSMENLGPYSNFHELNQDWFLDQFNKLVEQWKAMQKNFDSLEDAFNDLKSYVQDYFKNLDVQDEINNKLDEMYNNGDFNALLSLFIPYVTPEMYGAIGDGVTDDSEKIQNCINSAIIKNVSVLFMSKKYKCDNEITITDKVLINGNGASLIFNSNGINVNPKTLTNGITILNLTIDNISGFGIKLNNAIRSIIENIFITNCSGTGVLISGDNYESKLDMISIIGSDSYSDNIGIDCSATDITFNRILGRDIKTFIDNKNSGNIYSNCHAWLYNKAYFSNSIFANVQTSALFDKCIIDTYETGFNINPVGSSRLVNCNWIVNTLLYNNITAQKAPTFIVFTSNEGNANNITLTECWLSMPEKNQNWFDTVNIFNRYNLAQMENCSIFNCDDAIYYGIRYKNKNDFNVQASFYRENIKNPHVQLSMELTESHDSGSKIFTLPSRLCPTYSFYATGICRKAETTNFIPCSLFISNTGDVYVSYDNTDGICNSFIFNISYYK
jgi:hypothetical protein